MMIDQTGNPWRLAFHLLRRAERRVTAMMRPLMHATDSVDATHNSLLDLCDLIDLLAETTAPLCGEPPSLTKQRIEARVRQLGEQAARVRRTLQARRESTHTDLYPRLAQ